MTRLRSRRLLLSLSLTLLAIGCRLDVSLDTSTLGCDDGRCPDGLTCGDDRLCHRPQGDAGAAPDGPPLTGPCNKITLLADSFAGTTTAAQWGMYSDPGVSVAQLGGRLRISLPSSSSTNAYGGYVSAGSFDLSESAISMEIAHMVSTLSSAEVYLAVLADTDGLRVVLLSQQSGNLHFVVRDPGGGSHISIPYDAVRDRHFRVRESGGTLYFETSPDGSSWGIRHMQSTPFDLTLVRIEIAAGVPQPEVSPGFAEIEQVNGGVATGRYCKSP